MGCRKGIFGAITEILVAKGVNKYVAFLACFEELQSIYFKVSARFQRAIRPSINIFPICFILRDINTSLLVVVHL